MNPTTINALVTGAVTVIGALTFATVKILTTLAALRREQRDRHEENVARMDKIDVQTNGKLEILLTKIGALSVENGELRGRLDGALATRRAASRSTDPHPPEGTTP